MYIIAHKAGLLAPFKTFKYSKICPAMKHFQTNPKCLIYLFQLCFSEKCFASSMAHGTYNVMDRRRNGIMVSSWSLKYLALGQHMVLAVLQCFFCRGGCAFHSFLAVNIRHSSSAPSGWYCLYRCFTAVVQSTFTQVWCLSTILSYFCYFVLLLIYISEGNCTFDSTPLPLLKTFSYYLFCRFRIAIQIW